MSEAMKAALAKLGVGSALEPGDIDAAFNALVTRRRRQAPYRDRQVRVFVNMTAAEAAYVIFDQGPGFDTSKLPDDVQPESLDKPGTRGTVLMRAFMDRVTYSKSGNMVTMLKKREARKGRPCSLAADDDADAIAGAGRNSRLSAVHDGQS